MVTYYLRHRAEKDFESKFLSFLRKLLVVLLTKYLESQTLIAVKADILKLNVEIMDSMAPKFDLKKVAYAKIETKIKKPNKNIVKMLLKIVAYTEQDNLLPEKWEIEHILPQKWQSNYFLDVNEKTVKEKIEHIGNKIPFEKKLNIAAGNGYFDKKKMYYESSKIACVKTISKATSTEWNLEDITERDIRITDTLKELINKWNNDYNLFSEVGFEVEAAPTEEEKLMIEKIKKKGWLSLVFDKLTD